MRTTFDEVPDAAFGIVHTMARDAARAVVASRGAQVLSWVCRDKERLFVSKRALSGAGQAIRGGVPVIFPQFADAGSGPRHGFARLLQWSPLPTLNRSDSSAGLRFQLCSSEDTRKTFPYEFRAELDVTVAGDDLCVSLRVENLDRLDFSFTTALHTYLRVADVTRTRLYGLEGMEFLDSTNGGRREPASGKPIQFDGEIDRIYPEARGELSLSDGADVVRIQSKGFTDTVVWNPGRTLASRMTDLGEDQFDQFVCVESGSVAAPQVIPPGDSWRGTQRLTIIPGR